MHRIYPAECVTCKLTRVLCSSLAPLELTHVFPDKDRGTLLAVVTMQHAKMELARWGEDVEAEKDALLEKVSLLQLRLYLYFMH